MSEESVDEPGSRTEDLFREASCGWTKYYTEHSVLQKVWEIYQSDYAHLGWYDIDVWKSRLSACLEMG